MLDVSRYFLAACKHCGEVWCLAVLPIPLDQAGKIAKRSICPNCDSTSEKHSVASKAQAEAWAAKHPEGPSS